MDEHDRQQLDACLIKDYLDTPDSYQKMQDPSQRGSNSLNNNNFRWMQKVHARHFAVKHERNGGRPNVASHELWRIELNFLV